MNVTHAPPPLEARGLTRRRGDSLILSQVDLQVEAGQIVALQGANGSGKTTLLHCLAGLLRPHAGQVLWLGESPLRRPACRQHVGLVAHDTYLYPELSARENLLFAARMHGVAHPLDRVNAQLEATDLTHVATRAAGRLSQGMRQRLSLARALIHEPPIVILDEPFTGLDPVGRDWLERWLLELRRVGRAICFTSHDDAQSQRVADLRFELRARSLIPWSMPRTIVPLANNSVASVGAKARSA